MKLISIITILIITSCNVKNSKVCILKKTTDERGLTSVIFKQGNDTFALDYLTKLELDSLTKN